MNSKCKVQKFEHIDLNAYTLRMFLNSLAKMIKRLPLILAIMLIAFVFIHAITK